MKASPEFYAVVCFLTIIHTNDRWDQKHVSYVMEKMAMLREGLNAFAYLDYHNMKRAINYLASQHIDVPTEWTKEYEMQIAAAEQLGFPII